MELQEIDLYIYNSSLEFWFWLVSKERGFRSLNIELCRVQTWIFILSMDPWSKDLKKQQRFFQADDSSKKQANEFNLCQTVIKTNSFVHFFEGFEDTKKSLSNSQHLRKSHFNFGRKFEFRSQLSYYSCTTIFKSLYPEKCI